MSGPNNRNWRGGPLPYYGPNWRQARRNARLRDRYTCQRCGVTEAMLGKQLDVHHIEPFRNFGVERYQEANGTANLISLCPSCHLSIER
jgi:5-methylcytosine-specific restriction endonuclease McrA